jgi:ABC-type bacteriocin/lantibiotic exporter with double-glycine peptidase domain
MKTLLVALMLCASVQPVVDLPPALRQSNWVGSQGQGSCVFASTISLLNWQNRPKTAKWIRNNYGNGSGPTDTAEKFDRIGLRYAMTTTGDVKFLEWSMRTRRGCAVVVRGGSHFVCLVSLDAKRAAIMDNNDVGNIKWVTREAFLSEWVASGGWSLAVVYSPPAPKPL